MSTSSKTKTFKLTEGISGHGEVFHTVTFREPRFSDWVELGNTYILNDDGKVFPLHDKVDAYLQRCIVEPKDYLLVRSQADLSFAMEVSNWIVGFSLEALVTAGRSQISPTT